MLFRVFNELNQDLTEEVVIPEEYSIQEHRSYIHHPEFPSKNSEDAMDQLSMAKYIQKKLQVANNEGNFVFNLNAFLNESAFETTNLNIPTESLFELFK
uniref:Uncharacterized protein n=1 Tax=Caenorhabditis tropicalis TaxID=1561998 RepID=A0A1I7TS05_9PELO